MADNKEKILEIIDGWQGKLTYELLSEKLQTDLGLKRTPSRHTYLKHDEITHAFGLKKEELRNKRSAAIAEAQTLHKNPDKLSDFLSNLSSEDATISELIKWIGKLEDENKKLSSEKKRLKDQNNILLERFARWQHNLQKMDGVDMNKLAATIDDGLPAKNRR
ncbi:MAG: hypothetical protein ACMZ64_05505 [Oleiphilus sp.]